MTVATRSPQVALPAPAPQRGPPARARKPRHAGVSASAPPPWWQLSLCASYLRARIRGVERSVSATIWNKIKRIKWRPNAEQVAANERREALFGGALLAVRVAQHVDALPKLFRNARELRDARLHAPHRLGPTRAVEPHAVARALRVGLAGAVADDLGALEALARGGEERGALGGREEAFHEQHARVLVRDDRRLGALQGVVVDGAVVAPAATQLDRGERGAEAGDAGVLVCCVCGGVGRHGGAVARGGGGRARRGRARRRRRRARGGEPARPAAAVAGEGGARGRGGVEAPGEDDRGDQPNKESSAEGGGHERGPVRRATAGAAAGGRAHAQHRGGRGGSPGPERGECPGIKRGRARARGAGGAASVGRPHVHAASA
jgi:hypothetical protein